MKILKFLFAFALLASFTSCDPDEIPMDEEILGTWKITAVDLQGTATTTDNNGDVTEADVMGTGFDMDLQITIEENPNNYSVEGDFSVMVEYTIDNVSYEIPFEEAGFIDAGTWVIDNDVLIVDGGAEVETATVANVTETSLVLDWVYTQTITQFGTTIVQDITGTYTFEKL